MDKIDELIDNLIKAAKDYESSTNWASVEECFYELNQAKDALRVTLKAMDDEITRLRQILDNKEVSYE